MARYVSIVLDAQLSTVSREEEAEAKGEDGGDELPPELRMDVCNATDFHVNVLFMCCHTALRR
jgi:hypothetical protein